MASSPTVRVVTDPRSGWSRLVLTGRLTADSAQPLHEASRAIYASGQNVAVACDSAEYLDVSAVQILFALGRAMVGRGKRYDVTGLPEAISGPLRAAGIDLTAAPR